MSRLRAQLERWRASTPQGLAIALATYLCVRLPVECIALFSHGAIPPGPGKYGMPPMDGPALLHAFLRWDSGWYVRIIQAGYSYANCLAPGVPCPQASVAFMPAYPLLVRGLMTFGLSLPSASFLLTHVALIAALWAVYELARLRGLDGDGSARAAVAMVAFPTSIFLSAGYAEVLFLAAGIWGVVFLERRQLPLSAVLFAVAALTRSQGLLLLGAAGLVCLARRDWKAVLWLGGLGGAAIGGYLWWQHHSFGDALAFVHARRGWGFIDQPALDVLRAYWDRTWAGQLAGEGWMDFAAIPWLAVVAWFSWRTLGPIEGVFCVLVLAIPLSAGQVWAFGRIALCVFPAFLLLARWTARPRVALVTLVFGVSWVSIAAFRFVNGLFTGT